MDLPFLYDLDYCDIVGGGVSILILMDLPFLLAKKDNIIDELTSFNPYSNGSSFFIL